MLADAWKKYLASQFVQSPPLVKVLIVDDEPAVCDFVERVLQEDGYVTEVASDGSVALAKAETFGRFDLLVTDVNMPHLRGHDLARQVRRLDPDVKVLYLTGYSDLLFNEQGTLGEDEAFVEKPVSAQGLRQAISLLLTGHVRE